MQTRLPVLSLLAAAAACAQPASIFRLDPLDCVQMDGPGFLTVVPVDGPGFIHALHIRIPLYTGNFYDIRARCFSTQPAAKGDILVATFWMHTISAESGAGRMTFVVERGRAPWIKSVQWTTQAGFEWEKKQIALRMAEDYPSTRRRRPGRL